MKTRASPDNTREGTQPRRTRTRPTVGVVAGSSDATAQPRLARTLERGLPALLLTGWLIGLPCTAAARVLDDFDQGDNHAWSRRVTGSGSVALGAGALFVRVASLGQPVICAAVRDDQLLSFTEPAPLELGVDLVEINGPNALAVLGWLPDSEPPARFAGYLLAYSSREVRLGKGLQNWFRRETLASRLKTSNVGLSLVLGREGANVRVTAKVLDRDAGNAVLFERSFLDTSGADLPAVGTDRPAAPWSGPGRFMLAAYDESPGLREQPNEVVYDNAEVSAPAPGNPLPVLYDLPLPDGASFLPTWQSQRFHVIDDQPLDLEGILPRADSPGLLITACGYVGGSGQKAMLVNPDFRFATNRESWINYVAVDAQGATNMVRMVLDTFQESLPRLEAENYDFEGGQFLSQPEDPALELELYAGRKGVHGLDFQSAGPALLPGVYRPQDSVRIRRTVDYVRRWYAEAGGAEMGVFDYDVALVHAGEFLNYTRDLPWAGYEVYLRASLRNLERAEAALEFVPPGGGPAAASDASAGTFVITNTGYVFRNVPLQDESGNKKILPLAERQTLRLRQVTDVPDDADLRYDYLVLVPVVSEPPLVEASLTVTGPYALESGVGLRPAERTITLGRPVAATRFYRLRAPTATPITGVRLTGGNLELSY